MQAEKARRSNLDTTESGSQRKCTKYNSGYVLSGLLICGECGSPYPRITRSGGEVVWHCVNRVEHGKVYCKDSVTVTDTAMKELLRRELDMPNFDKQIVHNSVKSIIVGHDGSFDITFKQDFIHDYVSKPQSFKNGQSAISCSTETAL